MYESAFGCSYSFLTMLAPSLALRGFSSGGRSRLWRPSPTAMPVFGTGIACRSCVTLRQCCLVTARNCTSLPFQPGTLIEFLILGPHQSPCPQCFPPDPLPSHPSQPTAKDRKFCRCCRGGGCCCTCHVRIIPAPGPSYLHNAVLVKCCPVQDTLDAAPGIIDIKKVPPLIAVLFDLCVIGLTKQ